MIDDYSQPDLEPVELLLLHCQKDDRLRSRSFLVWVLLLVQE